MQASESDRLAAANNNGGAPGLQIFAELSATLGSLATEMRHQRDRQQKLWSAIRPIPGIIIPQITTTNGVADYPELCSPRSGYWWDVHAVVVGTFSAGTVNLYLTGGQASSLNAGGGLPDSNQRYAFTSKGALTFGKAQLMVPPGNRLVFAASAITGNASPAIYLTEIASWALPDYLL